VALLRDDPLVLACEYFGRRLVELGDLAGDPRLEGLHAGDGLLLVELGGPPVEVESRVRALSRAPSGGAVSAMDPEGMEALWETRHAANPVLGRALAQGRRSTQFIEDCVVPPTRVHDFLTGLDHILDEHRTQAVVFGHVGDGNLHVNPLVDLTRSGWREEVRAILEDTVELVAGLGGTLAGEHGDGRLRTPYLHRFFDPDVIHAFGTVKAILDPAGILNPGVIVPVPGMDPLEGLGDAPAFASGTQGPEGVR
jgi:FAD/FMN-containing dehydrogenase